LSNEAAGSLVDLAVMCIQLALVIVGFETTFDSTGAGLGFLARCLAFLTWLIEVSR
jgi:hypothetical protein